MLMTGRKNLVFALVSAAIFMDMMVYTMVIPVLPSVCRRLGRYGHYRGHLRGVLGRAAFI